MLFRGTTQKGDPGIQDKDGKQITNSIGMKLVLIPAGKFMMGSPDSEKDRETDEGPQHEVEITRPFYMGVYLVTQAEYERVMGKNPSFFSAAGGGVKDMDTTRFPVEMVSWNDAVEFCRKLSQLPEEKQAGRVYRLPTEAEWEYACRAGTTTRFYSGNMDASLEGMACFRSKMPVPVGQFKPNAFGLYDMHGNVSELCSDCYEYDYYKNSPRQDPEGVRASKGIEPCKRGGWFGGNASDCRSASRRSGTARFSHYSESWPLNETGFRVVCVR